MMAISHSMEVEGDTLVVRARGFDDSLDDVRDYGIAVIEACVAGNVTNVLCDELELEYRLGTFDTFRAAEFIAQAAPMVGRVALVCDPKQLGDARFWENSVVNRGLTARVFTDETRARSWLARSE
jgi:hypothetical protein